jgi:hypothetical protein
MRIGAYALVTTASGMLTSKPTSAPDRAGCHGSTTFAARNPIAKRLKNAAVSAVGLSGNFIGSIRPTSTAPTAKPSRTPERGLFIRHSLHRLTATSIGTSRLTVRSPKAEHHVGHEQRIVPATPKLMALLQEAFHAAPEGQERIVPLQWGGYCRKVINAALDRAEIKPWPRFWQTLRTSCEKEWAMSYPQFAVSKWIGRSIVVSGKHCANHVPDELFDQATKGTAQNTAQQATNSSENEGNDEQTEKAGNAQNGLENADDSALCASIADGAESSQKSGR